MQAESPGPCRSARPRARPAFTLIELLVVVVVIVILMGLILPALKGARKEAVRTKCRNNLRQIGVGIQNFAARNNGFMPETDVGTCTNYIYMGRPFGLGQLYPHLVSDLAVFFCPAASFYSKSGPLGMDGWGNEESLVASSYYYRASLVVFPGGGVNSETLGTYEVYRNKAIVMDYNVKREFGKYNHGGEYVNILFADGRVVGLADPEGRSAETSDETLWAWADEQ